MESTQYSSLEIQIDEEFKNQDLTRTTLEVEDYRSNHNPYWGKCKPFLFKNSYPRIVIGPHCTIYFIIVGPLFILAYLFFGSISVIMVLFSYRSGFSLFMMALTVMVCLTQMTTYLLVALINPGIANVNSHNIDPSQRNEKRRRDANWFTQS